MRRLATCIPALAAAAAAFLPPGAGAADNAAGAADNAAGAANSAAGAGNSAAGAGNSAGAVSTQARTFMIAPEDSGRTFMCPAGAVQSISATASSENRPVPLVLLDHDAKPIPQEAWAPAYGFRLDRRQQVKVRVMMICGS